MSYLIDALSTGWVLDIETTLDHETIRLIGVKSMTTEEVILFPNVLDFFYWFDEVIDKNTPVFTWNGSRFDIPVLETQIYENLTDRCTHIDLMLLAKMVAPDENKYSMDHWAKLNELEVTKGEIDYDHAPIEKLADYLETDLEITRQLAIKMITNLPNPDATGRAISLEVRVARECQRQVDRGVRFDIGKATLLLNNLESHMAQLENDIAPHLPTVPIAESKLDYPPTAKFKKDGTLTIYMQRWLDRNDCIINGEKTFVHDAVCYPLGWEKPVKREEVASLSNLAPIKTYLLDLGWEPTEWNFNHKGERTGARLTLKGTNDVCPDLLRLGFKWVEMLAEWLTVRSRRNVLCSPNGTGWLPYAEAHDGIIPSDADTMGANTARWTHRRVANVPRVTSLYGKEMRELFCAREGKWWVGWDASSLEARCEAHYTYPYDKDYADELMDGDIHTKNLHAIHELRDRDHAKTFKYGITYGAQVKRVAKILGCDVPTAQIAFDAFWINNDALASLKSDLQRKVKLNRSAGYGKVFKAIDGRFIHTRSEHSQLNALFQSCGAIVMKYAMLLADKMIRKEFGTEVAYGLIRYHDEEMWECETKEIAERVGQLGVESIAMAGRYLEMNVPLTGEYKVGKNWAECH